jgi:hypothetical protein
MSGGAEVGASKERVSGVSVGDVGWSLARCISGCRDILFVQVCVTCSV